MKSGENISYSYATTAKNYAWTAFKSVMFVNVSLGSLTCFASRSFFGGDQIQGLGLGVTLAIGTFGIAAATRVPAIHNWFFGKKPPSIKPVLTLEEETDETQKVVPDAKPEPTLCRRGLAKTAALTLKLTSVLQLGITISSTFLGLKSLLSYVPSDWTEILFISDYLIANNIVGFSVQNYAFNLKLNAFKFADDVEDCIKNGVYCNVSQAAKAVGLSSFNLISSPIVSYFSVVGGIPKIPGLRNVITGDLLTSFGKFAAGVGLVNNCAMGVPSIYDFLKNGSKVHLPKSKSTCLRTTTCGLIENPWVIVKNGFVYPFGFIDNLGSGAFTYTGVSNTMPKLPFLSSYSAHTPGIMFFSALCGLSSTITGYAFSTRGGMIKLLPEWFKKQLKEKRLREYSSQVDLNSLDSKTAASTSSIVALDVNHDEKAEYASIQSIDLPPPPTPPLYTYSQSKTFFNSSRPVANYSANNDRLLPDLEFGSDETPAHAKNTTCVIL